MHHHKANGLGVQKALFGLQTGAAVEISQPMGDFVLPKLQQTPLVWVAGGIGITPFISQLKLLTETGEPRPIRLLWAVSTEDDIVFRMSWRRPSST